MAIKVKVNTAIIWGNIAQAFYPRRALAKSASGRLWAVYAETFANNITVSYSDDNGLTWIEEVAVAGLGAFPNLAIVLVVDSVGVPHLIWVDYLVPGGFSNLIQYTNRTGGVWAAPATLYNAGAASIANVVAAIDAADTIHIAFQDALGSNYMARIGGVWGAVVLTTGSYPGAIDTNSALIPHIVSAAGGPINMVRRVGGIWQVPEVISAAGWGASVSFDSGDNLHVAWVEDGMGGDDIIRYRKRDNLGAWGAVLDVIDDWQGTGVDALPPILTVDIDGNAYIITQKDNGSGDDTVYYKKITAAGVVGALSIFDAAITRPGGAASCYTGLFHGGSSSSLVAASYHPVAVVLEDNAGDADGYFERQLGVTLPAVQTDPASAITSVQADLNGILIDDGGEPCDCGFEWGLTPAYGHITPTDSKTTGQTFAQTIIGLTPGTTYHFRALATNSAGTTLGADRILTTLVALPTGTTNPPTTVAQMSTTLNGTLDDDGGEACDCGFQWGKTGAYGGTTPTQSKNTGQTFAETISPLEPGTEYHFRAFARNSAGTGYGADRLFRTYPATGVGYALSRSAL